MSIKSILPFLVASFLDYLNIVVPLVIFPVIMINPEYTIIPHVLLLSTKTMLLGFLLTIFYVGQFIAVPVWGRLSDIFGRRSILCVTMTGMVISVIGTAYAVDAQQYIWLFIARFVCGLFAANIALAQATVADMSDEKNKVNNLSYVEIAVGIGFIVAGLIGGGLSGGSAWFSLATPFWVISGLAFANLILLAISFKHLATNGAVERDSWFGEFSHIGKAFIDPRLRGIFMIGAMFIFGWNSYTQFFSTFLLNNFNYDAWHIGITFTYAGFAYALFQLLVVQPLSKVLSPYSVLRISLLLFCVPSIGLFFAYTTLNLYIILTLYVLAIALTLPNIVAIISNLQGKDSQGEVISIIWSLQALIAVVGTFLCSFLAAINTVLPLSLGGLLVFVSWVMFLFMKEPASE